MLILQNYVEEGKKQEKSYLKHLVETGKLVKGKANISYTKPQIPTKQFSLCLSYLVTSDSKKLTLHAVVIYYCVECHFFSQVLPG